MSAPEAGSRSSEHAARGVPTSAAAASRSTRRVLAGVAALLALAAIAAREPAPRPARGTTATPAAAAPSDPASAATASPHVAPIPGSSTSAVHSVDAVTLARWIRDARPGLRVLDVRAPDAFAAWSVPTAENVPLGDVARQTPRAGETLVVYAAERRHAERAAVLLRRAGHERVHVLSGGALAWIDAIERPVLPAGATPGQRAAFDARAELARYFGGVPVLGGEEAALDGAARPATSPDATAALEAAVGAARRRGC